MQLVRDIKVVYNVNNSDRIIYVEKFLDKVVGINYMQGNCIETFTNNYMQKDEELTSFFLTVKDNVKGDTIFEKIDNAIWMHHQLEVKGFFNNKPQHQLTFNETDVQSRLECTDEQAYEVLNKVANNEWLMGEINVIIGEVGEAMGLKEKKEE